LVGVVGTSEAIKEGDAFVVVAERGLVELLEAEVHSCQFGEGEYVGVLRPEGEYDGLCSIKPWDKEP
jgi:hypothetical protein